MDIRKVKKLIELLKESGLDELEMKEGEESVRISRHNPAVHSVAVPPPMPAQPAAPAPSDTGAAPKQAGTTDEVQGHTVNAPMVGTAYLSASPGAAPFVEIGQRVEVGTVLCVIEAMKMFNQIEADKAGVISARLIENESPVEYDQPLFVIE